MNLLHCVGVITLLFIFSNNRVLSAPRIVHRGSSIGILPIVDCPDDVGAVVVLPSLVGGTGLAANQYVVCFQGEPLIFNCSEGLFFNWSIMSCDFPYERLSSGSESTNNNEIPTADGDLDLIPAGPIQVPISPQWPIPIWTRQAPPSRNVPVRDAVVFPILPLPYPITKPNPDVVKPVPVLPANPTPLIPRPVPYL